MKTDFINNKGLTKYWQLWNKADWDITEIKCGLNVVFRALSHFQDFILFQTQISKTFTIFNINDSKNIISALYLVYNTVICK